MDGRWGLGAIAVAGWLACGSPSASGPTGGAGAGGPTGSAGSGGAPSACGATLATDAMNCGACGHTCLGGACVGGRCQPVKLGDVIGANGLAIDGDTLVATNGLSGEVLKLPKAGGPDAVAVPVATSQRVPASPVVDATGLYWCNVSTLQAAGAGAVMRIAKGQTAATPVADLENGPETLAVDATHVYWTDRGSTVSLGATGQIRRAPLAGGVMPERFVMNIVRPWGIAIDATNVYWVESRSATSLAGGRVAMVPKAGGTPTVLAPDQLEPVRVRLDADHVYWANRGDYVEAYVDGGIYRMPKAGGLRQTIASGEREPRDFVIDARYAYWVTASALVRRAPLAGGAAETLYSDPTGTAYIALAQDDTALYWASDRLDPTLEGAAIWRLAK